MNIDKEIANIAGLIGDPTRSAILIALMEGRALTAGELALRANISPQTASNHLSKLLTANIIVCEQAGRHRYYKIASMEIAQILESLSLLAPVPQLILPNHKNLDKEICFARTCYDHLAGELGVKIFSELITRNYLTFDQHALKVTDSGKNFFKRMQIDCDQLLKYKRQFVKACVDWTERKHHLAGSLGAYFLNYFIENRLLIRSKSKSRVVILTTRGEIWLKDNLFC